MENKTLKTQPVFQPGKEFNWKLEMRYFRTSSITLRFERGQNKRALEGLSLNRRPHQRSLNWDFLKLPNYWEGIRKEFFCALNIDWFLSPLFYIIGRNTPSGNMGKRRLYLLNVQLLIARKVLTLLWLKPPCLPNLSGRKWRSSMQPIFIDIFRTRWAPVSK